ncbi:hypothetical protein A2865_04205 [Candidatus Woesebacteria bacterium RIFCSPHIGHO2_01_FULL_39_17]|uniref:Eight-cysteine-cluster domain-containing protein n=1 Tax=Candidatus Woesebacteria bacterium RIFCSPLOWO2_01_FULL_39_14 TaxID=1802518 RepID=A0A1F8BHR4_9BACT|nr:MAG: hypothetical protein A2865_04205 [Candidatus Woesebacteria bacterium RIFCSPHIGHO2_01_FULL_39_17]OGM63572.1 MAG: hypothetical protein A3A52_01130 [Candidatus Woesebacteria bacterium RIFCSPLOWO2_01_FULL_39_14]
MKRVIAIILLISLLFFIYFYFSTKTSQKQDSNKTEVLTNEKGAPLMATGNCNQDTDCFPSGCSSQICANHEVITTCEVVEIPEKETYSCGCVENRCVWYRDRKN